MEYEDTNILRTQYVDDLVNQRDLLEDVMVYQNALIESGEGLNTMVPKVQSLTGAKVTIPFISFANCDVKSLSFSLYDIPPKYLNKVFYNARTLGTRDNYLDISSGRFNEVDDFSYMFSNKNTLSWSSSAQDCNRYLLLKSNFNFAKAFSIQGMFYGKRSSYTNGFRYNVYINGLEKLPVYSAPYLKDASYYCYNCDSDSPLLLLTKIIDAPVENIRHLITPYNTGYMKAGSALRMCMEHILNKWDLSNLKDVTYLFGNRYVSTDTEIFLDWILRLNWKTIEKAAYLFYYSTSNISQSYGKICDLRDCEFDSLNDARYMFHITGFDKILLGPANNATLTNLSNCFACGISDDESKGYTHEIDFRYWDLSNVISCYYLFKNRTNLTTLYFGKNLGKGFVQKTNNYYAYTIWLAESQILSKESVLYMFNRLYDLNITYDVANGNTLYTQKIDLHADVITQLTAEDIAIATNKGWTVA